MIIILLENERNDVLRAKVIAIGRMAKIYKTLRENNEILIEIKEMSSDGKIPRGLLLQGKTAMKDTFKDFLLARVLDS